MLKKLLAIMVAAPALLSLGSCINGDTKMEVPYDRVMIAAVADEDGSLTYSKIQARLTLDVYNADRGSVDIDGLKTATATFPTLSFKKLMLGLAQNQIDYVLASSNTTETVGLNGLNLQSLYAELSSVEFSYTNTSNTAIKFTTQEGLSMAAFTTGLLFFTDFTATTLDNSAQPYTTATTQANLMRLDIDAERHLASLYLINFDVVSGVQEKANLVAEGLNVIIYPGIGTMRVEADVVVPYTTRNGVKDKAAPEYTIKNLEMLIHNNLEGSMGFDCGTNLRINARLVQGFAATSNPQ